MSNKNELEKPSNELGELRGKLDSIGDEVSKLSRFRIAVITAVTVITVIIGGSLVSLFIYSYNNIQDLIEDVHMKKIEENAERSNEIIDEMNETVTRMNTKEQEANSITAGIELRVNDIIESYPRLVVDHGISPFDGPQNVSYPGPWETAVTVDFNETFSRPPIVFVSVTKLQTEFHQGAGIIDNFRVRVINVTPTSFRWDISFTGALHINNFRVSWIAIGPPAE